MPGITLNVAYLEVYSHHRLGLARSEIHLADATWSGTHVARSEVGGYLFSNGILTRKLLVQPEIDKLLAAVQGHIILTAHLEGNGTADALVVLFLFQLTGL